MPDKVERFDPKYAPNEMARSRSGGWVRHSDYEKLEAERDKLEDMLEQAKGDFVTEGDRADKLEAELREAVKQRDEELVQRLIGLHNGTAPDRDERYQMAWRAGVAAARDAIREEKSDDRA